MSLNIAMAQVNPVVGDIPGNTALVINTIEEILALHAPDIVVFPELVITAYPPEDLLLRASLDIRVEDALNTIKAKNFDTHLVIGYPGREQGHLYNMLCVIFRDKVIARYRKQCLPNYQVFDEKRYFAAGTAPCVIDIKGVPVGFSICEDLWEPGSMSQAESAGAKVMININGSPFHADKMNDRLSALHARQEEAALPIIYVNQVGGQDELVFDGCSMAVDEDGTIKAQAPACEESVAMLKVEYDGVSATIEEGELSEIEENEALIYKVLTLGLHDYVVKNGFSGVVLGLSGGIDSALTLAIAVDALGKDKVHAVMMPFKYTSGMSIEDAEQQAGNFGVNYQVIPIENVYEGFMASLAQEFSGTTVDLTEQNLQARCRGVMLMAISNKRGYMVLTTGNKSEMAVGYSTLYGDMAGGFDVLKDVPKMLVYALSRFRNNLVSDRSEEMIPWRVIERPPSAELAPDQVDEDNLPPYAILDQILELYIEGDQSAHAIIDKGFDHDTVMRVLRLVDLNEYKRRQAPVGVRISKKGFGRDRRYPITSGWKLGE
ncbi:MAG: NAD+ synthase (glutamine-hydrolyzing) [Pseudohongiellaceae bacterium]|jgi:NAD+ synthase (glutamine-hydrolysing)